MQATTVSNPNLSPSFDKARHMSKWLARLLTVGFWLTVLALICLPTVIIFLPADGGTINFNSTTVHLEDLTASQRIVCATGVAVMMVPWLFLLNHARRVFGHFVVGEVFAVETINHIGQSALWLMMTFATAVAGQFIVFIVAGIRDDNIDFDADPSALLIGVIVYVAAYVMAEARRIADDNASIV